MQQPRNELLWDAVSLHNPTNGAHTLIAPRALAAELDRVRSAGYAVNNEELAYGLHSIAAPVRAASGEVVAAINLAVHRSMMSMEDLTANLSPVLCRAADEISARSGCRRPPG